MSTLDCLPWTVTQFNDRPVMLQARLSECLTMLRFLPRLEESTYRTSYVLGLKLRKSYSGFRMKFGYLDLHGNQEALICQLFNLIAR